MLFCFHGFAIEGKVLTTDYNNLNFFLQVEKKKYYVGH